MAGHQQSSTDDDRPVDRLDLVATKPYAPFRLVERRWSALRPIPRPQFGLSSILSDFQIGSNLANGISKTKTTQYPS